MENSNYKESANGWLLPPADVLGKDNKKLRWIHWQLTAKYKSYGPSVVANKMVLTSPAGGQRELWTFLNSQVSEIKLPAKAAKLCHSQGPDLKRMGC